MEAVSKLAQPLCFVIYWKTLNFQDRSAIMELCQNEHCCRCAPEMSCKWAQSSLLEMACKWAQSRTCSGYAECSRHYEIAEPPPILCKDSHTHAKKANFSAFSYMKPLFFQLPSAQPSHFLGMHRRFFRLHFLFPYLHFFLPARYFLLSAQKKFITKFVIHVTNFLTHVTNFVICVTNFVTKNVL